MTNPSLSEIPVISAKYSSQANHQRATGPTTTNGEPNGDTRECANIMSTVNQPDDWATCTRLVTNAEYPPRLHLLHLSDHKDPLMGNPRLSVRSEPHARRPHRNQGFDPQPSIQ